ncbi:transcription termination factor N-utilization substance protein B [Candidatus Mycoplasma haematolamae str. Purdue]|uniref:Transcription termination factor N-utilization substance protein B n=1 Tax=Mycoplasma haematolamae (strain Purdue) TaxID=1212765 RepID=I7B8Y6_MYCHA|nr:transcription antitermination factor NusB [Candidatus Mycoplasma haematolamae]AFO51710.1 transcription termination factor N-utilization substance protein B [Candidatus Mycoplasma haematolamae str. Purdue]
MDNPSPRLKKRLTVFEAIYSNLVLGTINEEIQKPNCDKSEWGGFEKRIFKKYIKKKEQYLSSINELLASDWDVSRLNLSILAVLLEAFSEYETFKTDPSVLIHQAILIAREYGEDEHKLVHAVIDAYLRQLRGSEVTN